MKNLYLLSKNQLSLSDDRQKLLLKISPIDKVTKINDIVKLINNSEYKNFKVHQEGLKKAMDRLNVVRKHQTDITKDEFIIIASRRDAKLSITLNSSKMTAKAHITSAFAGKNITLEQLMVELQNLNIISGINYSSINLLLERAKDAADGTCFQITIANGMPPQQGHNTHFTSLLKTPKEHLIDYMSKEYGSVDMNNIKNILVVPANTKLLQKSAAMPGLDGFTVTGEILPYAEGKEIPFSDAENTQLAESDPNLLISQIAGTPVSFKNGIKIETTLILDQIDANSPYISHNGSLIVKDDVPPGSKINVKGDITVIGFIHSSDITCSGDLFVSKGILGKKSKGRRNKFSSNIKCGGALYANFIHSTRINVEQDLNLQYQLIDSTVYCGGYINVKDKENKKGTIIGGHLYPRKGIRTVTLGASSDIKTNIDLNTHYSKLEHEQQQLELFVKKIQQKLSRLRATQHDNEHSKYTIKTKQADQQLTLTISEFKRKLFLYKDKLNENQRRIHQCLHSTEVIALKAMHSNVHISIGKSVFRTKRKYDATTIHIKNRKLVAELYKTE